MTDKEIENRTGAAWDKTKGKVNEVAGAATGDRSQELKGKAQGVKGNVREGIEDAKDEFRGERRERDV